MGDVFGDVAEPPFWERVRVSRKSLKKVGLALLVYLAVMFLMAVFLK